MKSVTRHCYGRKIFRPYLSLVTCHLSLFLLTATTQSVRAQSGNEFFVTLGGGRSSLDYQLHESASSGGGMGVGYTLFFSRSFGLSFGLEAASYGSTIKVESFNTESIIPTPQGLPGDFFLQVAGSGREEKQRAVFLQLPLLLHLQLPVSAHTHFFLAGGAKVGFPVVKQWTQTAGTLTTRGYSPYTNQVYENMPRHGFETQISPEASGSMALGSPVALALEGGFKWKLSGKTALYTAVYFDYGLNNIYRPESKNVLEYNAANPTDYQYNSFVQSEIAGTQGCTIKSAGIKIRIAFGKARGKALPPPLLGYLE
jgi:hypothetical protein